MKNNIILRFAYILVALSLFTTCETDMEKAQDDYSAGKVTPVIIGTSGSDLVLQTFTYPYSVTYFRAGSTWNWTATNATVDSVSADKRTAYVLFDQLPADDTALVSVKETSIGGITSAPKVLKVKVNQFCPLTNWLNDLVGTWSGYDGQGVDYTDTLTSFVTTSVSSTKLLVSGVGASFMVNFWGENIVTGGTFLMTVNENGTLDIPQQFYCHTDWDSDYDIRGTGTWDNCGPSPTFKINYDIYYYDSGYWIAAHYKAYLDDIPYLTVNIALD
jgi:hypothetical protein